MKKKEANVQRPTFNAECSTKKLSKAALLRALAARTSGVTYRDRKIAKLEKDLKTATRFVDDLMGQLGVVREQRTAAVVTEELVRKECNRMRARPALELLDDCVGKLRAKAKANCGTALGYALTYLDEARPYVAHDALGRMNGSHSATRHHD